MKRASQQACPTPFTYYDTNSCSNPDIIPLPGCYFGDPCEDDDGRNISSVPKLGARELTINIIPAATSSAAPTSTQTTTKTTSLAPTKTTTAASSNNLHPSSIIPTSSGHISSAASTTVTQAASPVTAVSSPAPAPPSQASQSSHSRTVAVAAGAVGAIVGVIITLILIVLVLRWGKRRKEDKVPPNLPGNDLQLPKESSNGAGSTQGDSGKSRDFVIVAPFQNNPSERAIGVLLHGSFLIT